MSVFLIIDLILPRGIFCFAGQIPGISELYSKEVKSNPGTKPSLTRV